MQSATLRSASSTFHQRINTLLTLIFIHPHLFLSTMLQLKTISNIFHWRGFQIEHKATKTEFPVA